MSAKYYRQVAFDLFANKIKFKGYNPSHTYNEIKKIFYQNGFHKIQRSVYLSNEPIDKKTLSKVFDIIKTECPEIKGCVKGWTVTIYDTGSDYTDYMDV